MNRLFVFATISLFVAAPLMAAVKGTYVEARTAEVSVDGLSIVAAVVGDKNLGIHELGGAKPVSKSTLIVDARATDAQRDALVGMVKKLSGVVGTVVNVTSGPVDFAE